MLAADLQIGKRPLPTTEHPAWIARMRRELEPAWQRACWPRLFAETAAGTLPCGPGVCGWLTQALELTGVKAPRVVHTRCRFQTATAFEYDVTW